MIHIRKIVLFVFGLVSTIVGWTIWMEPQLTNFNILLSLMTNELFRLINDPFAILGLILMLLGFWTLFMVMVGPWTLPYGIDELISVGKQKKAET